jgi:Kef-type K+ transport system membrane component KefB
MSVTAILLDILILLVAAKIAAEVAERVGVPAVVGEIVAGILIGPSALGLVGTTSVLEVLGELGVILLLLQVGMEMDLADLAAVGRASMSVAVVGVVLPMMGGLAVASAFGHDGNTALFVGSALAATSVGITARVFSDLRALTTVEARTVLGAAVADDVLGLVILTVVVRIVTQGSVSFLGVTGIVGIAIAFLVIASVVGTQASPVLFSAVQRYSRSAGTLIALALAFTLGFAEIANAAKLAPIVGAFVAGLALSRSDQSERIERELTPIGHLLIPVFFLQIGIAADVSSFARLDVLAIAGALFVVAVAGKILAFAGAAGSPGDKWLIGLGMIPRGEVGLIFATLGLKEHVIGESLYASLLLVVLATTLITPPLLRWRLLALRARQRPDAGAGPPMPVGGWVYADDGIVDLVPGAPEYAALAIGLRAALAIADGARPGAHLLDWLGHLGDEPLHWDAAARTQLFALLDRGNARAWRFLETTGLLERGLPELADPVRHRRADPFLVDPGQILSFAMLEALEPGLLDDRALSAWGALEHPDWLRLAALVIDALDEDKRVAVARRLVQRLDLGAAAEEHVAFLVGNVGLLRGTARRFDGLAEESVLRLAVHLGNPERARALYLLELALAPLEPVERSQLDELLRLVLAALEQPELTGLDARNLVERRRLEARRLINGDRGATERIELAPRAYVIATDATGLAHQARLLEPLPRPGRARVAVFTDARGTSRIDVAARDRPGLLATVVGVLDEAGFAVLDALVATWPDGGAIESFATCPAAARSGALVARDLEAAIERALHEWPIAIPAPDADVRFDDAGSPWYTICEVRAPDRRGLLRAITVGLANAGVVVHSARVQTTEGDAVDAFEVTDANGRKLEPDLKATVVRSITEGVLPRRRLRHRFQARHPSAG